MAAAHVTRPDLALILGRFCDSLAFLRIVQRSLESREVAGDEATALRIATEALQATYNDLDQAMGPHP